MNTIIAIIIGLVSGWLSGLVGIGGGIIIVPALMYILHFSVRDAQGTSIAALAPPIGLLAAYIFYKSGNVNINVSFLIAIGFVIGSYFGAKSNYQLNPVIVEKILAFTLIAIGIKMLLK